MSIRAGDSVKHRPSGETWLVAVVVGKDLYWYGWPEGYAHVEDCDLIVACDDEKHRKALEDWGAKLHYSDRGFVDSRSCYAREQLMLLNQSFLAEAI